MADLTLKQGNLEPPLFATLKNIFGAVPPLATATSIRVTFATTDGVELWVRDAAIQNLALGQVVYLWQPGDTDVSGAYYAEVVVTWPTARPQTFPPSSYLLIVIEPKL